MTLATSHETRRSRRGVKTCPTEAKRRFAEWVPALALVGLLGPSVAWATPVRPPESTTALRVATYNIESGAEGLDGVIDTLRELDADIIGLQEVDRLTRRSGKVDQAAKIAAALGMYHGYVKHFDHQGGSFGLAILSRYPVSHVERHGVKLSNLALLEASVSLPAGRVTAVVVHFHPTMPFDDERNQVANTKARLREAHRAVQLAGNGSRPALVLGDMNDDSGSDTYEILAKSLSDACADALLEKTWPSTFPMTRIDYIWVSSHFAVRDCDAISSLASDHRPLVVELTLSTAPQN